MTIIMNDDNTMPDRIELWGASTKHPDSVFYFKDHKTSGAVVRGCHWDIYQWLIEVASQMTYPFHTVKLVRQAESYILEYIAEQDNCSREEAEDTLARFACV